MQGRTPVSSWLPRWSLWPSWLLMGLEGRNRGWRTMLVSFLIDLEDVRPILPVCAFRFGCSGGQLVRL